MNTHISLVIEELQGRVLKLNAAIETLKAIEPGEQAVAGGNGGGAEVHSQLPMANRQVRPKLVAPVRAVKSARRFKDGSRSSALQQAKLMVAIAAGMPEPITAAALAEAVGLRETRSAAGALWRWAERSKWVKRVGSGQYVRTKSFPKADLDEDGANGGTGPLSDQLRRAKAELAEAIAKHEPTQARVLADKVAEIEDQLTRTDE